MNFHFGHCSRIFSLRATRKAVTGGALLFAMLYGPAMWAQGQASISGTITDPSGAAVPEVEVIITDTRTNVSRTTVTNASGSYTLGALVPDPYVLSAQAKGFKRVERSEF